MQGNRLLGCAAALVLAAGMGAGAAEAAPFYPPFGLDLKAQDPSVKPGDDFFQYVNGAWLARTAIPPDQSSVSMGRDEANRVEARLHELLQAAAESAPARPTSAEQKVGAMYSAFMDEAHAEALGATPIRGQIQSISDAPDKSALAGLMGQSLYDFGGAFFAANIDVDLKNPVIYAVYLSQAGLGLPDREYYLTPDFADQKQAYRGYVQQMLSLVGWKDPAASADAVLAMETRIAEASWTKAEQRDLDKVYNPMAPDELQILAPGFDWYAFLKGARLEAKTRVVVAEKSAFPKIAAIFANTPIDTVKAWLAFTVADSAAPYLSKAFQQARFELRDKTLGGQAQIQPRWKRAIAAVSGGDCGGAPGDCFGTLNWAVGQIYTDHDFTAQTKAKAKAMVDQLLAAFHARLEALDWMSPATKAEALKKLETYTVKVGYPDHQRDYSNVTISRDDLVGDVRNAAKADWEFYVKRSFGVVDRTDWQMTPQTVDAYNGSLRDIVFPAAILQPAEFDPDADDAVNFGAMGAIIGHELTHGFDDQGRAIDAAGLLRDWWTPQDAAAFKAKAAAFGAQYAAFEPAPGVHINPDLTMGENIADLGGLLIALDAYHASLKGQPAPVVGGLTGDQRLFLSYAQSWRGKAKEDAIRRQTVSDPHSYRKFRVLGPLPNIDAWYAAFGVKAGDKMYREPKDRVRIW